MKIRISAGATVMIYWAAGAMAGYNFALLRMKKKYEAILDEEIQDFKREYGHRNDYSDDFDSQIVKDAAVAMEAYQGKEESPLAVDASPRALTAYGEKKDNPLIPIQTPKSEKVNYGTLTVTDLTPTEETLFVISRDEYFREELEYVQAVLTYYQGDDQLVGEVNEPFNDDDRNLLVGGHLSDFGEKSGDENVVYIRNHKCRMDFEVVREPGKYTVDVLGEDDKDS